MSNFEPAVDLLLKHEGGYVNNKNDAGSSTNFGVSLTFLKGEGSLGDFNGDGIVNAQDIADMTVDDAKAVYKKCWWDTYNYGTINDQTIATKVFDFSVNMGPSHAHKLLQSALNSAFGLSLVVDGALGPATFKVINNIPDDHKQTLITMYSDKAWGYYQQIIAANPSQQVFANGWKNRAYAISQANSVV